MRIGTVNSVHIIPDHKYVPDASAKRVECRDQQQYFTLNVRQSVLPLSLNAYSTPCSFRPPEHSSHKVVKAQEEGRSGGERISNFQALDYIKKTRSWKIEEGQ